LKIDKLLMAIGAWGNHLHNEIYVFDNSMWRNDKEIWEAIQGSSWDEVILEPAMKQNLIRDLQGFFDNREPYKKLSVPWKRGIILHGVPGNGKTISIKALIKSLYSRPDPIPSLYVKSFNSGSGEKHAIRTIFDMARKMAPCLLIFEDLDSLIQEKTRSYFLNEVDGLESNDGILMIGSTNHLDKLDPAISKRPSRFDRKYNYKLPGEAERTTYCRFWRDKLIGADMVDFPEELCPVIAQLTDGFSFAYLKELFVIVLLTIARSKSDEKTAMEMGVAENSTVSSEDGYSTDGHVIVDRDGTTAVSTTAFQSSVQQSANIASTQKKEVLPHIELNETLKHSVLLKVVVEQVSVLFLEMDNTKE